jgi:hypothetical protein
MDRAFLVDEPLAPPREGCPIALEEERAQRRVQTGVTHGLDPQRGVPFLRIRFAMPDRRGAVYNVDCSAWMRYPALAIPFADVFFTWGGDKRVGSIDGTKRSLTLFFTFLAEHATRAPHTPLQRLLDLTPSLINAYIDWLNARRARNGRPLQARSKASALSVLRTTVTHLRQHPRYGPRLDPHLHVRDHLWPGQQRGGTPRATLTRDAIIRMQQACVAEIGDIMARLDAGAHLIAAHRASLPTAPCSSQAYREVGGCLAALDATFPGPIPPLATILDANRPLGNAIQIYHSRAALVAYLYATPRVLVPFVLMLGFATLFNPDTLLGLTWSQIRPSHWFFGDDRLAIDPLTPATRERIEVRGMKPRARQVQVRTFPAQVTDPGSPAVLLRHLERLTRRLRPAVAPRDADRVFLFELSRNAGERYRSYGQTMGPLSSDDTWHISLKAFIRDHALPPFTLAALRATGSDLIHELTGGDITAQQTLLGHRSAQTTAQHYTSDGARKRQNETLATVQTQRERWVRTNGKSDTRHMSPHATRRAVTPGFECVDPFDSPVPDQRPGQLCTAYLACPVCPLAVVTRRDPQALAQLVQLEHTLLAMRETVIPQRSLALAPQLDAITHRWLPAFTDAAIWTAAQRLPTLPPIIVE